MEPICFELRIELAKNNTCRRSGLADVSLILPYSLGRGRIWDIHCQLGRFDDRALSPAASFEHFDGLARSLRDTGGSGEGEQLESVFVVSVAGGRGDIWHDRAVKERVVICGRTKHSGSKLMMSAME